MDYIRRFHPGLVPLYDGIYRLKDTTYWPDTEKEIAAFAGKTGYGTSRISTTKRPGNDSGGGWRS